MSEGTSTATWKRGMGMIDFRTWSDRERHLGSVVVIVVVAVLLVAGIALQFLAPSVAETALWALVFLVVLALAYEGLAVWWGLRAAGATATRRGAAASTAGLAEGADENETWAPPAPPAPAAAEPDSEPEVLTLRCGNCATQFDVTDDGTRPLYHTCPGCGAEGVLRGEPASPAPAPAPAAEPESEEDSSPWAKPARGREPEPAAEPEPEAPKPVKRVKLRCPGCKHVFPVEDDGTRPLRTRCPSCDRLGEIR